MGIFSDNRQKEEEAADLFMAKMAILSVQKTEQRLLRARTENLDNELIMETGPELSVICDIVKRICRLMIIPAYAACEAGKNI